MEILPNSPAEPETRRNGASDDRTVLTSDFETFLTLLTTQMRNQDPLNPMESTEFATQLATFSGVEQQVRTNELLESLSSGFSNLGLGQLGDWIGMTAMADMPAAFSGAPIDISASPAPGADRMELVVRDAGDSIVQRLPIPLSDQPFSWAGTGLDGQPLPPGSYGLTAESWRGEELLDARPVLVSATVEEARLQDGGVILTMEGGTSVSADSVVGLRRSS